MQINGLNRLTTDVLIIGGGTAGCYAALTIREKSDASIIIAEKANIKRSGCLAAGVNAINAYIVEGRKPEDYVEYAKKDADDIVREDLLLTMSERLNEVTAKMEKLGLVILKDENGRYVARGNRNIKINGENIKPRLRVFLLVIRIVSQHRKDSQLQSSLIKKLTYQEDVYFQAEQHFQ